MGLASGQARARSHSTPAGGGGGGGLPAPRIDISRASSSSHQDSRDSSPELALFAGAAGEDSRARLELGFREDGALDLRSSTEELTFLEDAPGEPKAPPLLPQQQAARHHSRKDSQSSEVALLAVSGRTSRLSSVGSQCSAHSALSGLSRISRLSITSGVSRSPSPHKMLLETSFCGPRPIENDPEICAAAVEERLLEIAKLNAPPDSRDRREVRAEVTVEVPRLPPTSSTPPAPPAPSPVPPRQMLAAAPDSVAVSAEDEKQRKENANKVRAEERRGRPRLQRETSEPEVYKTRNLKKDVIRIKLKPDEDYEEEEEDVEVVHSEHDGTTTKHEVAAPDPEARVSRAVRPTELVGRPPLSPAAAWRSSHRGSRSPSPAGPPVSRKSSFCSLFKSRETIGSPDSPSDALRRKRSLTEGGGRSKSRERSSTPTSASKIRGSVLSLFRTPRRSVTSPSPSTREGSPVVQPHRPSPLPTPPTHSTQLVHPVHSTQPILAVERLRYYDNTGDGIIHIPLRTPPEERADTRRDSEHEVIVSTVTTSREQTRPASAPVARTTPETEGTVRSFGKPVQRTVLPDGSIIIPLHSPTEPVTHVDKPLPDCCDFKQSDSPIDPSTSVDLPVENRAAADGAESSPTREQADSNPVANPNNEQVRRKQAVFITYIDSCDQVFTTEFSITKTPSIVSEISGSLPSFGEGEDGGQEMRSRCEPSGGNLTLKDRVVTRDSSESEPSSEAAAPHASTEVERRRLVIQDSFEEELPYVPTTLPLERSVALPMVPVRDRSGVRVAPLQRPRATVPPATQPRAPPPPQSAPPADKLRIRLPRRQRPPTARLRTRSSGDGNFLPLFSTRSNANDNITQLSGNTEQGSHDTGQELRPKQWIDFEEVPERRKQPKRIQTLPGDATGVGSAESSGNGTLAGIVFSYVEPEQCRCECHGHARAPDLLRYVHHLMLRPYTDLHFRAGPSTRHNMSTILSNIVT